MQRLAQLIDDRADGLVILFHFFVVLSALVGLSAAHPSTHSLVHSFLDFAASLTVLHGRLVVQQKEEILVFLFIGPQTGLGEESGVSYGVGVVANGGLGGFHGYKIILK